MAWPSVRSSTNRRIAFGPDDVLDHKRAYIAGAHQLGGNGHGFVRRITTIFTQSLNRSQTPAQFSSPDQRMQRLNWPSIFTFVNPS